MAQNISPENARYIDDAVRRGFYSDEQAALNAAVRLLKQWDRLRVDVQAGIEQANRGELLPGDGVFERLEERARQIEEAAQSNQ